MNKIFYILFYCIIFSIANGQNKIHFVKKIDSTICHNNKFYIVTLHKELKNKKHELYNSSISISNSNKGVLKITNQISDKKFISLFKSLDEETESKGTEAGFQLLSNCIVEIKITDGEWYRTAAHGDNSYEKEFYDLRTQKPFGFEDVFEDSVHYVINGYIKRTYFASDSTSEFQIDGQNNVTNYSFESDSLIIEFHYLQSGPIHVGYMQQTEFLKIPYIDLLRFIKKDNPIYRCFIEKRCTLPG